MENCIFCRIVKKEIPSKIVYEDNNIIVIEDINAQAPIHILVIPKKHIQNIQFITEEDTSLIYKIYKVINHLVKDKKISDSGFRIVINTNDDGGQTVPHLHFHVLGGRTMTWPPG